MGTIFTIKRGAGGVRLCLGDRAYLSCHRLCDGTVAAAKSKVPSDWPVIWPRLGGLGLSIER